MKDLKLTSPFDLDKTSSEDQFILQKDKVVQAQEAPCPVLAKIGIP
jgi:hypothetical protein